MTSPLLWYLNRGTGVVLLIVFTATVVLGVLATGRSTTPLWPRFITQGLHRALAASTVLMLVAHVVSAVVDEYVDIRWWQAFVPFGSSYEPLWMALGAISLDLLALVIATSLARARIPHRVWFVVHLTTYVAWASALVHGLFIGTDSAEGWMVAIYVGCAATVGLAVLARIIAVLNTKRLKRRSHQDHAPRPPFGPQSGVEREARHADRAASTGGAFMTRPMIRPPASVDVHSGPLLLSGIDRGPGLAAHRARLGALPEPGIQALVSLLEDVAVRGRGGAGFPLARKLQTVMRARGSRAAIGGRRPYVVVNAAEGEPASAKDSALLDVAPHLVLDGAVVAARALGAKEIHVVTSEDRPWVGAAVHRATTERDDHGIKWVQHEAASRFVSGQSRALIELMAGRPGLPVTSWAPEAIDGHRRRPTLLSNAESFAHLAAVVLWGVDAYAGHGTPDEPGTSLLTLTTPPAADGVFRGVHVVEVEHGDGAAMVLDAAALSSPLLVGGFHGSWVHPRDVPALEWSNAVLGEVGARLGAGSLLSLSDGSCPVSETARYTSYLAGESAGRCGPCRNGLPAMATEMEGLVAGADTRTRLRELAGLVTGRGACAHPDGTARLVGSLLTTLDDHVEAHLERACGCAGRDPRGAIDALNGEGEIVLRTRRENGWAIVSIEDSGPRDPRVDHGEPV